MNRAYSIETRFQRENIAPIQFRMMEKCLSEIQSNAI